MLIDTASGNAALYALATSFFPKNFVRPVHSDAVTLRMKFDHEIERMNSARAGCLPVRPPNAFGSGILESRILRLSNLGALS